MLIVFSTGNKTLISNTGIDTGITYIYKLFDLARKSGWVEPPEFDTAPAFSCENKAYKRISGLINSSELKPNQIESLCAEIKNSECDQMHFNQLRCELISALKAAKRWDGKDTAQLIDEKTTKPVLSFPVSLPAIMDVAFIPPHMLSQASGNHGNNAVLMLLEIFGDRIRERFNCLWWWSGSEWASISPKMIRRITYHALEMGSSTKNNVEGTISALLAKADDLPDTIRGPLIFFKDCVLDIGEMKVRAHQKSDFNTGTLSINLCSSIPPTPNWSNFLDDIFGGLDDCQDRKDLLQEIIGWAMLQDDLNAHKIIALDGVSRAGKSLILELLSAIMGDNKCGTTTFSNIANGKTQSAFRMYDVVIDVDAEAPPRRDIKAAMGCLKKVASNEKISIELLHVQEPWNGRLNTKMLIACNGIPTLMDDSGATTNRFQVLKFERTFKDEKEDRGLLMRIMPEIEAIANWAIGGAVRLVKNKGRFTQPVSSTEAMEELRDQNQPLVEFIQDCLEFGGDFRCHSMAVWKCYDEFARARNIPLCSAPTFQRSIKKALKAGQYQCEHKKAIRIKGILKLAAGYEGFKVKDLNSAAFTPKIVK